MRAIVIITALLAATTARAQAGPGGVGSSGSNVLWLDANSGVIHSSNSVSQWSDRSGNANHALLPGSIPLARPTRVPGAVNGYPALGFDGTDDQLWVTDNATVDLTAWHFFLVLKADVQKDYNAWMVKGNDGNENYEMLSYSDGNIHAPTFYTNGTRTFPSSLGGQVSTTAFNIFEYSYNASQGRDIYRNGSSIHTDDENLTPQTNNFPLYIGNERGTTGRVISGDIAEVVAYNTRLNAAQRLVVNNYLAAKYGITLASGDLFVQDNAPNGNFDHDVAGIGRVNGTNLHTEAQGSGVVRMNKAAYAGLDDNEYLFWGHNNDHFSALGSTDFPTGMQGRLHRVWRVSEVNNAGGAVDVGNVDITWDHAGLGPVTASDLRLLVDTDGDGVFADETPISGATNPSGTLYRFWGIAALTNGRRFTIGTINMSATPLPVEFIAFTATREPNGTVLTNWSTASEQDNDRFTVQRSLDAQGWVDVTVVDAAGNSNTVLHYASSDPSAPDGICYYRVQQTDLDGTVAYTNVAAVEGMDRDPTGPAFIPNPSQGDFVIALRQQPSGPATIRLLDASGRMVFQFASNDHLSGRTIELPSHVANGRYIALYEDPDGVRSSGFILAR
ncbi:MAG: LamG-like jellyroll fold domain-containing protein [Flavobacteriales bacterium]